MKQIWKFRLDLHEPEIELPKGAVPLDVQMQNGFMCLWALVTPNANKERRRFPIYGTGQKIEHPETLTYIATVQISYGYVWHVFEEQQGK